MAGFTFKNGFHAIIVFSAIIISMGIVISGWNSQYDSNLSNDLGGLNKLDSVSTSVSQQKGKLSPNDPDPGENSEARTFRGVYGILANIFSPFDVVFGESGLLATLTYRFGLPDYIRQVLLSLMIVTITMALIGIIFRLGNNA